MAYLIGKVEALEKALLEKNETPTPPVDRWLNIDELIIGKTKSTNFQNEKYKKGMSFKYYINGA